MYSLCALQWCHNGHGGISNHQPHHCLLNCLLRRRSKKTSKLCGTGLCAGNSPVTGEFPTQMASNAENVSVWWRHHGMCVVRRVTFLIPIYNSQLQWTITEDIHHYLEKFKIFTSNRFFKNPFQQQFDHSPDDLLTSKLFSHYWPFMRGIRRSLMDSPHRG